MAPQTGLEPVTYRLTAGCSTIELLRKIIPQRPTLPGRYHPSTISAEGLNFCVRDGNRCDTFAIVAEYFNYGIWYKVYGIKRFLYLLPDLKGILVRIYLLPGFPLPSTYFKEPMLFESYTRKSLFKVKPSTD